MRTIKLVASFSILLFMVGCASIPVDQMNVKSTILTAGGEGPRFKRVPQEKFTQADQIVLYTVMDWADLEKSAGFHDVNWKWYNNDQLVRVVNRNLKFRRTPFTLWSYISGQSLGVGKNKVELYIDGKLIASQTFSVE